jgi:ABC-type glycerol-3-phosphate transport system substrate-binding protein
MFKNMSKFQLIVLGLFVFFTMGGLVGFALYKGNTGAQTPTIVIWGTVNKSAFNSYTDFVSKKSGNALHYSYVQLDPGTFDQTLVEALATNHGPDAILVSQETLLKQANKITFIPYESLSKANFKSAFIQESDLFLAQDGIRALPFAIDPMVMYWNRTMFTNALISQPPKYWDQLITLAPLLTKKGDTTTIIQSAIALGEYANIDHAKDILGLLLLQAGNPLVVETSLGYQSTLNATFNSSSAVLPSDTALMFYTQFADPRKDVYSWNRSMKDSKSLFLSDNLAMYLGYASELQELREKNPNLNFDVAMVPQPRPQEGRQPITITHGRIYGLALLRASKHPQDTFNALNALVDKASITYWSQISNLPAVRRDALNPDPADVASSIFANSALISRGWLDPDRQATDQIYKNLIESVTSGRALYNEALLDADQKIQDLIDKLKL